MRKLPACLLCKVPPAGTSTVLPDVNTDQLASCGHDRLTPATKAEQVNTCWVQNGHESFNSNIGPSTL